MFYLRTIQDDGRKYGLIDYLCTLCYFHLEADPNEGTDGTVRSVRIMIEAGKLSKKVLEKYKP